MKSFMSLFFFCSLCQASLCMFLWSSIQFLYCSKTQNRTSNRLLYQSNHQGQKPGPGFNHFCGVQPNKNQGDASRAKFTWKTVVAGWSRNGSSSLGMPAMRRKECRFHFWGPRHKSGQGIALIKRALVCRRFVLRSTRAISNFQNILNWQYFSTRTRVTSILLPMLYGFWFDSDSGVLHYYSKLSLSNLRAWILI